ncbi:MAG: polysaccharide biosynthesis protein PslG [Solirubrobacterales bacterium]|nr:polysaccharide biosynthesis protein PslG [Solirubrobacterales bacterium]
MSRTRARLTGLLACALLIAGVVLVPVASGAVKPRFWGLNFAFYDDITHGDAALLKDAHVRSMRFTITWKAVQPQAPPVPGQQPTSNWDKTDALFTRLATLGIQPRPLIFGSPPWVNGPTDLNGVTEATPPVGTASARGYWRSFVAEAVNRYKPGGAFWTGPFASQHPGVKPTPVHLWQVWNEPNIAGFFAPAPSVTKYAKLLEIAHHAIVGADPSAKVALAGMPGHVKLPGPEFLRQLYAIHGIKRDFDMVAAHPYGPTVAAIKHEVGTFRKAMHKGHDSHTPLWISETSWSSAPKDATAINQGLKGQARMLKQTLHMYAHHRKRWKLNQVSWFDLHDPNPFPKAQCEWCQHAGLVNYHGQAKPAWNAFRKFTDAAAR